MPKRVVIVGAAGRDFHNFNTCFRDNPEYRVVAFLATQLPNIANRVYPPELAGSLYPEGIPILPYEELPRLVREEGVEEAILAYSDLTYEDLMHQASELMAYGLDFRLIGWKKTMLESKKPVIAVCAVRTGAGKSTVTRAVCRALKRRNVRFVAVRHPMAYGDLLKQKCERFASYGDLDRREVTIEEREEIEPLLREGVVVYTGVDYACVLEEAEKEADVIIWDGGNNDFPFFKPDFLIVVADALRPGQEVGSYPGEINVRMADIVVINKVDVAEEEAVRAVEENVKRVNPKATIVKARSEVSVDKPELIEGKRVLVVEDGPTITHGGLSFGAGFVAANKYGAAEIVDPRPYALGSLKEAYEKYPQLGPVLPSMGYGIDQIRELEATINAIDCDTVILGTPSDLAKFMVINKPVVHVKFELKEVEGPTIDSLIEEFLKRMRELNKLPAS